MQTPPTPDEIRKFIQTHSLTQKQFADMLPVSIKTVEAWLRGTKKPNTYLGRALRDLEREIKNA